MDIILPFMEYMEAKRNYTDVKARQRNLHLNVKTLQQKNKPIHDFKKRLDTTLKRLDEKRDGKKEAARKRFRAMGTKRDESEKLVCALPPKRFSFSIFLQRTHKPRKSQTSSPISRPQKGLVLGRYTIRKRSFRRQRPI